MKKSMIALEEFLGNTEIPEIKEKPLTFLAISKQPHYENVWSNIYAFFFNIQGEHGFGELFISSLLQVIQAKHKAVEFSFSYLFNIETEYATLNGGRIDLLLISEMDAIIIENKVYHHLDNDLEDYWDTISQENKIGIVLSLKKIEKIDHKRFINITHLELLSIIMGNLDSFLSNSNSKYLVFLEDFYQNIFNLSEDIEMKDFEFYYQHFNQIEKINKLQQQLSIHLQSEVEKAAELLEGINLYVPQSSAKTKYRYYLCKEESNLMYTIFFERMMTNERNISIIVELKNKLLVDKKIYDSISFTKEEKALLNNRFKIGKSNWAHFAAVHVSIPTDMVGSFSNIIANEINEGSIGSVFNKLKTFMTLQKTK